ncbi:MAG: hypothetical protein ABIE42_09090, partial [Candidatus Eisenbacteria bacterium]
EDLDAAFSAVDRAIERFPGYADLWHLKMNLCALKWRRATSPYRFQNEANVEEAARNEAWRLLRFHFDEQGDLLTDDGSTTWRSSG